MNYFNSKKPNVRLKTPEFTIRNRLLSCRKNRDCKDSESKKRTESESERQIRDRQKEFKSKSRNRESRPNKDRDKESHVNKPRMQKDKELEKTCKLPVYVHQLCT